jgi:hypothetical protein
VRLRLGRAFGLGGWDVAEADQVDLVAGAVFGNFQQVENAEETRFAGKLGRDVGEADGLDRIDFDFTFFHAITAAHLHVWARPDANAAGDVSATNAIAKALGEHHGESLRREEAPENESHLSTSLRFIPIPKLLA